MSFVYWKEKGRIVCGGEKKRANGKTMSKRNKENYIQDTFIYVYNIFRFITII